MNQYLLVEEVAKIARTSVATVRYWIATERLRSVRPGRRRLVVATDLEEFMNREVSRA